MKRTILWILLICMIMTLSSCSLLDEFNVEPTAGQMPIETALPTEPAVPTEPGAPTVSVPEPTEPEIWSHEATVTRFLTEVNHDGEYLPGEDSDMLPPGTLPDPARIPQPDQSLVGQTVPIILALGQTEVPFCYSYDAETGTERLALVVLAESWPLLLIVEPTLGGARGLCDRIAREEPFDVKILAAVNISGEEGGRCSARRYSWEKDFIETLIDVSNPGQEIGAGIYLGIVGKGGKNSYAYLIGGDQLAENEAWVSDLKMYKKIFTRFSVLEIMGL